MIANNGRYKILEGDIICETASNTLSFPIKKNMKMLYFTIDDYDDYSSVDNNMGLIGGYYHNFFPFVVNYSQGDVVFSFYNEGIDYWLSGVSYNINENTVTCSNTRGVQTIPGAKYHYLEIYEP